MKRKAFFTVIILSVILFTFSCGSNEVKTKSDNKEAAVTSVPWGEADGKKIELYTLTNEKGTEVKITNFGGIVTSWRTKDKNGENSNIVLGFDSLGGYLAKPPYFGATIGRYANRIANASFTHDRQTYQLAANDGKNTLHGGDKGFDKVVWDAMPASDGSASLTLSYLSKDGEEGYPGNLKVTVKFTLTNDDALEMVYDAETDKATPVNLTNHSYFNLTGDPAKTILQHSLWIDADKYTPVDATLIPTGELKSVSETAFDFTTAHKIGERIAQVAGGYDHNYVLNNTNSGMKLVAWLADSVSGRKLEVYTTEPGLQFYSGNFLDGTIVNSNGTAIPKYGALCLETQHFPDSPNKPSFPGTILNPGEKYHTETIYKVSLR